MNRRRLQGGLLAFVATTVFGQQDAGVDGPRGRFDDDLIGKLEGRWKISRQIRHTTVDNEATASWVLNHQFLQLHMKDVASPPKYEAIVLIGYVHSDRQYVAHWTDTFGGKYSAIGRGTRRGNEIEFRFEYPDGPFYNTFTWQPDRKEWVFRMESQGPAGERRLFAIDTLSVAR